MQDETSVLGATWTGRCAGVVRGKRSHEPERSLPQSPKSPSQDQEVPHEGQGRSAVRQQGKAKLLLMNHLKVVFTHKVTGKDVWRTVTMKNVKKVSKELAECSTLKNIQSRIQAKLENELHKNEVPHA